MPLSTSSLRNSNGESRPGNWGQGPVLFKAEEKYSHFEPFIFSSEQTQGNLLLGNDSDTLKKLIMALGDAYEYFTLKLLVFEECLVHETFCSQEVEVKV